MKKRPKRFDVGQYGIVAGKKIFPSAVKRNRAKRLLREWIRGCEMPEDQDVLLVARPEILEMPFQSGLGQMKKALKSKSKKQPESGPGKRSGNEHKKTAGRQK